MKINKEPLLPIETIFVDTWGAKAVVDEFDEDTKATLEDSVNGPWALDEPFRPLMEVTCILSIYTQVTVDSDEKKVLDISRKAAVKRMKRLLFGPMANRLYHIRNLVQSCKKREAEKHITDLIKEVTGL